MKKALLSFYLTLVCITPFAQDFTGTWEGEFSSDMIPALGRRTFFLHMEIEQHGRNIKAMFYTANVDYPDRSGVIYKVTGKMNKQQQPPFRLTADGIIEDNLQSGVARVFNDFLCKYFKNDTIEVLHGPWYPNGAQSPRSDGAGGFFKVRKVRSQLSSTGVEVLYEKPSRSKQPPTLMDSVKTIPPKPYMERRDSIVQEVISPSENIELSLYDNGVVDGDIISIYLNDSLLLQHKKLGLKPISVPLKLEKGKAYKFTLLAENLGSIPPNTAFLFIKFTNKIGKSFQLSCDEDRNVSILIKLKDD